MTIHYTIQPATWHDLLPLQSLERECFQDDAWPLIELLGVLIFPGTVHLKAVSEENQFIGFIAGDARRSEGIGWILTIGVEPKFRRQGVARALLQECEVQMQLPKVRLSVRRSNQSAIDLYEKLGYRHVDVWKKYYHNGEDGLVMEKKMNP